MTVKQQTHYFIGIKVPDEMITEIEKRQKGLITQFPFQRWVHPLDYHITLAFLGGIPIEKLRALQQLLEENIKGSSDFLLHINHLGVFGNHEKPRIFWAGLEEDMQLNKLRDKVYEICLSLEFTIDSRPFHPHITLARKWEGDKSFSPNLLDNNSFTINPLNMKVDSIQLFQTHLNQEPKYEVITSYTFADNH